MANTLSLHSLLDNDKLIKSNFDSWYQKLKIILEHKRILYVLTDLPPKEPTVNVSRAARDTCMKWLSDRMKVHCIMRVAINDKLSHKFEDAQPKDMIKY